MTFRPTMPAPPRAAAGPLDPLDAPDPSEDLPREALHLRLEVERHAADQHAALEERVRQRTAELARARAAADQRAVEADYLVRLTFELTGDEDAHAVLARVLHPLMALTGADAAAWLLDRGSGPRVAWSEQLALPRSVERELVAVVASGGVPVPSAERTLRAAALCDRALARVTAGSSAAADAAPNGALALFRFGAAGPFSPEARALLDATARVVSLALERHAHIAELRAAAAHATALARIAELLDDTTLEPDAMAHRALQEIGSVADLDWGCVLLRAGSLVYGRPARGEGRLPALEAALACGASAEEGAVRVVVTARAPLFIDSFGVGPEDEDPLARSGACSLAVVPIDGGAFFCALRLDRPRPWTPRDQSLLEAAARSVRAARERWATRRLLEQAALNDGLTGLRNRRAFDADLTRDLAEAVRHGFPVSLIMVDVDGLKTVNDLQGHEAGDALLRAAGAALARNFRASDRAYRLGGDEFAVLLGHAGPEARDALMRRAEQAAAELRAGFPTSDLSVGLACFPVCARDEAALRQVADARMYAAKAEHKAARGNVGR
jgi:diguanylate cyclase (GGDEF)-like protein